MIRRLIAYLYLANYDPCDEEYMPSFSTIKQHASTTPVASAHHSRYRKSGPCARPDQCACLATNTQNVKQSVLVPTEQKRPSDYSVVEKSASVVEVANPLTIHATMYALGDKYQVDGLSDLAKKKFESCLHHHASSEDFLTAVQVAYSMTPDTNRGLRDVVVKAFLTHFQVDLAGIPDIEAKLATIDELSLLLIKAWPVKTEPSKPADSKGAGLGSAFATAPTSNAFGMPQTSSGFGNPRPSGISLFGNVQTTTTVTPNPGNPRPSTGGMFSSNAPQPPAREPSSVFGGNARRA